MSEDAAILDVIERETIAFLSRDFDAWAECWVQDEGIRRLGALMGGVMDFQEGWETFHDTIRDFFERFPKPNPDAAHTMQRTNISTRQKGDMAWVSFDQYGERSDDPLVTVGLSHQIRILERQGGQWKIAMAGHGDTGLEYMDFPVIRIDRSCRIEWMNDAASSELATHPALTKSGVTLRGRTQADDKLLRQAVQDVANLTVMERRPSLLRPRGRMADPVILTAGEADGQYLIWVSAQDGMLLVTFRDRANEQTRLETAAELYGLSPAQLRVAALVLTGASLQEIADQLGISHSTAKTHLMRVFEKTSAQNQPALIAKMLGVSPPN